MIALRCLSLCLMLTALVGLEPVERVRLDRKGERTAAIYQGPTIDGRLVLVLAESADPDGEPDRDLAERITRWTTAGALVGMIEIAPRPRPPAPAEPLHDKLWRAVVDNLQGRLPAGTHQRLLFVPPGHDLAPAVRFFEHRGRALHLDLVHPTGTGQPAPALLRIESGLFGADLAFWLADTGFAMAQIPDPFYDLGMDGTTAVAYGRAAAAALRAQARESGLNGRIGILGKSKHGFAAALIGAGATYSGSDPAGDLQAVIAMTDTLDPATRAEDFRAAGIRVDGNPGEADDPRGSPVTLLRPGGPAFFLCHAHGRTTRQSLRLIEVLDRHRVPYLQAWYEDRPRYAPRTGEAMRAFLIEHLASR